MQNEQKTKKAREQRTRSFSRYKNAQVIYDGNYFTLYFTGARTRSLLLSIAEHWMHCILYLNIVWRKFIAHFYVKHIFIMITATADVDALANSIVWFRLRDAHAKWMPTQDRDVSIKDEQINHDCCSCFLCIFIYFVSLAALHFSFARSSPSMPKKKLNYGALLSLLPKSSSSQTSFEISKAKFGRFFRVIYLPPKMNVSRQFD